MHIYLDSQALSDLSNATCDKTTEKKGRQPMLVFIIYILRNTHQKDMS